ncbi:MAG: peptidylprolyl isomerase [Bacteroidales bacterium]|nr:peptidylprolyl isomerase [Bacteroidales bacterium]
MVRNWGVLLLLLAGALCGCSREHDHKGKTPLVEVDGEFLYREDLLAALPLNMSKDDSTLFAEHYIRNWVQDILLYEKAEGNIPDNAKIARMVENYRRALIVHTYQEELINQRLANEIDESDIEAYYEKNKDLFRTEYPFVKGLFIKIPLRSQDLASVRNWYKRNSQDAIEKLEKYSLRNAVTYDYFYDKWKPMSEVAAKIPLKALDSDENYLDKNRNVEVKDTAYCYFLHVEEFLGKGQQRPLDFAKDEIKEILINLKRVEFINEVKEELYQRASDRNRINYYYLNSNE